MTRTQRFRLENLRSVCKSDIGLHGIFARVAIPPSLPSRTDGVRQTLSALGISANPLLEACRTDEGTMASVNVPQKACRIRRPPATKKISSRSPTVKVGCLNRRPVLTFEPVRYYGRFGKLCRLRSCSKVIQSKPKKKLVCAPGIGPRIRGEAIAARVKEEKRVRCCRRYIGRAADAALRQAKKAIPGPSR